MKKWIEEDEISMSKPRPQEFTPPSARVSLVPRKVATYEKRVSSSAAGVRKPTTGLKIDGLHEVLQIDGLQVDVVDSDGKPHPPGLTPRKPASIFQPHEALSPREGFQFKEFSPAYNSERGAERQTDRGTRPIGTQRGSFAPPPVDPKRTYFNRAHPAGRMPNNAGRLTNRAGGADDSFIYEDDSLSCAGSFSGRSLPTLPRASASTNRQESLGLRSETGSNAGSATSSKRTAASFKGNSYVGGSVDSKGTTYSSSRYSAATAEQMREYKKELESRNGGVRVFHDSIQRMSGTCSKSSSLHATTVLRLEHLMKEHKASWLFQFSKYDKEDSGSIYVDEFQVVLEKMEMGVSKKQLQEIMRSASGNGEKVNYLAFVDKYGGLTDTEDLEKQNKRVSKGVGAAREKSFKSQGKSEVNPPTEASYNIMTPRMTFLLGFIFFPLWCCGFRWCRDKESNNSRFARFSLAFLLLYLVIGVAIGTVFFLSSATSPSVIPKEHCLPFTMTLVALQAGGPSASANVFKENSLLESGFKRTVWNLVFELPSSSIDKRLNPGSGSQAENRIFLDEVSDIPFEKAGVTTLRIVFRILVSDKKEADFLIPMVRSWIQTQTLRRDLSKEKIFFDDLFLDRISTTDYGEVLNTPAIVKQAPLVKQTLNNGRFPTWVDPFSEAEGWTVAGRTISPYLLRQPPTTSTIFNPKNWDKHRADLKQMPTCWQTILFHIPMDDCAPNAKQYKKDLNEMITCQESGASGWSPVPGSPGKGSPARQIQIRVLSHHTDDLFEVYMRAAEIDIDWGPTGEINYRDLTTPPPIWFQARTVSGSPASVLGTPRRDMLRCSNEFVDSCAYTYTLDFVKSELMSFFWIGIVGKQEKSQYVPYEVYGRIVNVGNPVLLKSFNLSSVELVELGV